MTWGDVIVVIVLSWMSSAACAYIGYRLGADRMLRSLGHVFIVADDDGKVKMALAPKEHTDADA